MENQTNSSLYRAEGITSSERYLKTLADNSFLTLWCYSGVFRNQGKPGGKGDGKELCDLLVVFQDHILIFSDKDCVFPDTGNLDTDWGRWYKKAIEKSADQVYGAERWIKTFPDQIFLDRPCTKPFPISLPILSKAKVHRILVAHGAAARCKASLGGSGSLILLPNIIGEDHKKLQSAGGKPFAVGQINLAKGFVHIFDDTSLDIVLKKLDTITDFVNYLEKKERFVLSSQFIGADGEEELLGYYLKQINPKEEHDFIVSEGKSIFLEEGIWERFLKSPQAKAQADADTISYAWDHIINTFIKHIEAGTLYHSSHPDEGLAHYNKQLGFLARLSRFHRRIFAKYLADFLEKTIPPGQNTAIRTTVPLTDGEPNFIFLVMQKSDSITEEKYRRMRREALEFYCRVTKERFPTAQDIVCYATEPGLFIETRSDDLIYLDVKEWKPEEDTVWNTIRQEIHVPLFDEIPKFQAHEDEYPNPDAMRISVGDDYFDIQRPGLRRTPLSVRNTSSKSHVRKPNTRVKHKAHKKKPGKRAARRN